MKRPTITDSRTVVLRGWSDGVIPTPEIRGRANDPYLWIMWAYYTCRHYTSFTWTQDEEGAPEERIWMSRGEAQSYLVRRAMDGDATAMGCWQDLRQRGLVPAVGLMPGKGVGAPPLPTTGVGGWGPYCTRCRLALSTAGMEGYESVGGRYYGYCDNCKEHVK